MDNAGRSKLMIGKDHSHCLECPGIFKKSEVNVQGYCKKCWCTKSREVCERRLMSQQKSLIDATKRLADEISKRSRNTAISPEFFEEFSKELGGARGLGNKIAKDFKRLHGDGLSPEQLKFFSPDEKTIQRYWQTMMTFMQQQDRMNAVDVSSLNDKDLQATLLGLATGLMHDNPEFREHVIRIVIEKDPDLIATLARESGLLGPTIDGSVASREPAKESEPAVEAATPVEEEEFHDENPELYDVEFEQ